MKAFYISGTHWDREWHQPFQEFRMWLVQTMDHAVGLLQRNPEFRVFHLDGQVVMLEDYFEIRPERRREVHDLLKSGRLVAGPWYVLPDEWLVSGEAMIRNLQVGMRIVRSLGAAPMPVGYIPDMFGHVASMPTLFAGFGFKGAVLWRGINDDLAGAQFIWEGPDGSQMPVHKLPDDGGYGHFWVYGRIPWEKEKEEQDEAKAKEIFQEVLDCEKPRLNAPLLYLSDALDHQMAYEGAPEMLRVLARAFPDIEFVHARKEEYFDELQKHLDELPHHSGELRDPSKRVGSGAHWLIPHCLSSRYPLKQQNDRCQNLLTLWAEPLASMAHMVGSPVPPGYLEMAWKWLLRNHPHDSICGCSVDETHEDMVFRFHQCLLLGDGIRRQAMAKLSDPTADVAQAHANVVVYNPLPWERDEVVALDLLFPSDYEPKRIPTGMRGALINQFELVNVDGASVPYQILDIARGRPSKVFVGQGRRTTVTADVYRVAARTRLPAAGFKTLRVRPLTDRLYRDLSSLRTAPLSAENEHLRFALNPDGTGRLELKGSGLVFSDLFQYEDTGDRGDGWIFVPPVHNRTVVSPGHSVQCGIEQDGSQIVTFRVDRALRVPASLDESPEGERRSDEIVGLAITDFISVRAADPCLRVRTVVENTARDHRLRVLLPTDVRSDSYYADQPFAFVERPVATDPEGARYKEADPVERPHHTIFGIEGDKGGLAVLCPEGLHEHSVCDDARRTFALTLFRAFRRTTGTAGEPGGQLLGPLEFSYALLPYAGALARAEALRLVAAMQAGLQRHFSSTDQGQRSLLKVDGADGVVVTAVKPSDNGDDVIVRLWNTGGHPATARIVTATAPSAASLCTLNEEKQEELKLGDGGVAVEVAPYAIATVRLTFGA